MSGSENVKLRSGHEAIPVSSSEEKNLSRDFDALKFGMIRLQPGGWMFPSIFKKYADKYYEFKFKPSDVVVMTYPKCGTTWMQEIVWTMRSNLSLDNPEAKESVMLRSPFLDSDIFLDSPMFDVNEHTTFVKYFKKTCPPERDVRDGVFLQIAECISEPRTIKTHLPLSLLNPDLLETCKVIYVARNPKDVCLSYHHHSRLMKAYDYLGDWDTYLQYFMEGSLIYSPYLVHMKEAWEKKNNPNMLFCFYEEMKENPRKNIQRINDFLGAGLNDQEIDRVLEHTSFQSMKERDTFLGVPGTISPYMKENVYKADGGFFRKGESGDWKLKYSKEQTEKFDSWIRKNLAELEFGPEFLYSKHF